MDSEQLRSKLQEARKYLKLGKEPEKLLEVIQELLEIQEENIARFIVWNQRDD